MQLLCLVFNVEEKFLPHLQKVIADDLATWTQEFGPISALLHPVSSPSWDNRADFPSIQEWAEQFFETTLEKYDALDDLVETVYLIRGKEVPPEVIVALAEEIEQNYDIHPVVVCVAEQAETLQISCVDTPDLPLCWRVQVNDIVSLRYSVWSSPEDRDKKDEEALYPRGQRLRILSRQTEILEKAGHFIAVVDRSDGEAIPLVLPWEAVSAVNDDVPEGIEEKLLIVTYPAILHSPYGFACEIDFESDQK